MGKPHEKVSWLEKLGVTGLKSAQEKTQPKANTGPPTSDKPAKPSPDKPAPRSRAKLIFEPPIGDVDLLSLSQAQSGFNVTIACPDTKPVFPLLVRVAASGTSLRTVKISVPGTLLVLEDVALENVRVSSKQGEISTVQFRLDSPRIRRG